MQTVGRRRTNSFLESTLLYKQNSIKKEIFFSYENRFDWIRLHDNSDKRMNFYEKKTDMRDRMTNNFVILFINQLQIEYQLSL